MSFIAKLPIILFVLSVLIMVPSLIATLYIGFNMLGTDPYDTPKDDPMSRYFRMVIIALIVSFVCSTAALVLVVKQNSV
jgi:hypothetical protein